MRLSSKTRMGVQALYDMAFHCRGQQAQAKEIAGRQQIPVRTLEEVLQDLRRAGLVEAQRGPRGGYTLARAPGEITMSQIVRALDGPMDASFPRAAARDVPELIWGDIVSRITAVLGETTLGDFLTRAEHTGAKRDPSAGHPPTMYFI